MISINELIKTIHVLSLKKEPLFIAIDGRSGSGKTTLANQIKENLENAVLIHIDDFYIPSIKRILDKNLPVDVERLEKEVLKPLKNQKETKYQRYYGTTHSVSPQKIIIIEGWFALSATLFPYYDYTIWKEEDKTLCLERAVKRELKDIRSELTKEALIQRWKNHQLLEDIYMFKQNPQKKATVIIKTDKKIY